MENKDSFVFYRSFKESIGDLSDKDKLTMYEAISDYGLNQIEPELQGFPKALFSLIKPQLDANFTRWQNGCKGGAPKGNKNNRFSKVQPKYNQSTTEVQPNVNDNVNDNVNVIKKNSKKEILSFSDRQKSFHDSLIPFTELYGREMIRAFYDYWSEPTLARLRGSGQVNEAADMTILIYRPEYYSKTYGKVLHYPGSFKNVSTEGTALINVAKNRNGETFQFVCGFDAATTHFFDLDEKPLFAEQVEEEEPF